MLQNGSELQLAGNGVSGRHHVVQVDVFEEWLDLDSGLDSGLAHVLVHSPWVPVDSGHQTVWILSALGAAFGGGDDHGLSSGVSSLEENDDSSVSEDLS